MGQTELKTESSQLPEPASLELIRSSAYQASLTILQEAEFVGEAMSDAWSRFSEKLTPTSEGWTSSFENFVQFWHEAVQASHLLSDTQINALGNLVSTRGKVHEDWYTLAAFLIHDIHHLDPMSLFDLFMTIQYEAYQSGTMFLYNRHQEYLTTIIDRMEELSAIKALPLEFVGAIAEMESGLDIPQKVFNPLTMLEEIAIMIKGRFSPDDYDILINKEAQSDDSKNYILVNCSPDLFIQANKPMIFAIIYNLVKNAAKANGEKHYDQNDQALTKLYKSLGPLEHPMNLELTIEDNGDYLVLSVGDQADGLSLDKSLKRLHEEFIRRLSEQGIEQLSQSEWYRNLRRAFGDEQTEILFAWPKNPYALRMLHVGTILDAQFVAGFAPDTWEIRSVTSGTGLWGVRYITERLGGVVLATNKFEGGALFSVMITKASIGL
ncbi:hypothetical protein HY409_00755 [Candidatus Gottesmanbacteria bacterium]|nr:hypothetical protein [Candidatus Gottesmanbacteria bacterium]